MLYLEMQIQFIKVLLLLFLVVITKAGNDNGNTNNANFNSEKPTIYHLVQEDFEDGTYIISEPGVYILDEDISFDPNPPSNTDEIPQCCTVMDSQLLSNGGRYDDKAYNLGFFAAIAIETSDVEIDLNGHTIEQSERHALMQRFFAVIELADQPFIPKQGPNDFGPCFVPAENVYIHDGTIGRSSHHGIHGNGNVDVHIENVDFIGYEIAAVHLNGVDGLLVENCDAKNRDDLPVMGIFSSALFIQDYLNYLMSVNSGITLTVQGVVLSIEDISDALKQSIVNVYEDIMANGFIDMMTHPDEHALFQNIKGVIDGNAYGFVTNKFGVAVNGFPLLPGGAPFTTIPSTNVEFKNTGVSQQGSNIHEIVGLKKGSGVMTDPRGSVFQIRNQRHHDDSFITISDDSNDAEYVGNVVANAQLVVSKAVMAGEFAGSSLDVSRNSITQDVIDWVETGGSGQQTAKISNLIDLTGYFCNGDSMFHVNKGAIGFKIDGTIGIKMTDCYANNISNIGISGSDVCGDYKDSYSHPFATLKGYGGSHTRGFTFAGSSDGDISKCSVSNLSSENGKSIGFDIFTDSIGIKIDLCDVFAAESMHDAVGFHFGSDTSQSEIKNYCAVNLSSSMGSEMEIQDESNQPQSRNVVKNNKC